MLLRWHISKVLLAFIMLLIALNSYAQTKTLDSLKQTLRSSKKSHNADLLVDIAKEYDIVNSDSALHYATQAIAIAENNDNKTALSKAYIILGKAERNRGLYEQALASTLKGLKLAEKYGEEKDLAAIYNSIGILYKRMRRFDDALTYYLKANRLARKYNSDRQTSLTYNNIGTIYLEKEDWNAVERYYDSALSFAEKANDTRAIATVLSNYGDTYINKHEHDSALKYFTKCLVYDKANKDQYGLFMSYFQIARVYADAGKYTQAITYADSAEHIAEREQMNRNRIDLYGWRANVEEARGNIDKAYEYFKRSKLINDTLFTTNVSKQVTELQTKYETAKKEQQIVIQQSAINKRNYIIAGISIATILLGLLGVSYYNRYKLKQQDQLQKAVIHQQELATKAVIDAEERERKRIAGDLHDGVGQVMSAARMNLNAVRSDLSFNDEAQQQAFDKALSLVDEGCKEVRSVSHNIMPNALLKTGLVSAIREFIEKIDYRTLEVNLYSEGLDERLPSNIETVLYRVIQECVNNVIKHAQASKLDITLIHDEDGISTTIEDNGIGFDTTKDSNGVGLKNIQTRIDYLKSSVEWNSAAGKGTVVMIQIPPDTIA